MSKAEPIEKQNKRERRRVAAEAREAARKRRAQRRTFAYAIGGVALIAVVVLAVFALMEGGGDGGASVGPSAPGAVSVDGPARAGEPLAVGETVPGFAGPAVGGGSVRWSDFDGRPTALSVWAPWCPHCQVELPLLGRVMRDYPELGFLTVVTSIGTNPGPDPGEFLSENDIAAPTLIDDEAGTAAGALGIRGFPTLYLVDARGVVVYAGAGEIGEDELRALLGQLA